MKLIVTIDTEEDDWGDFKRTGHTLRNIEQIPQLQTLFEEFEVKPTYLITHSVATNQTAKGILKRILEQGKCEIGAHCHPWNTPPFQEQTNERNSMLCNLPVKLQYQKLETLRDTIAQHMGIELESFRAGRWGYSNAVAANLCQLGFKVDTSISPYCDWTSYHGPDFSTASPFPRFLRLNGNPTITEKPYVVEIPPTIGFLQKNQALCNHALLTMKSRILRPLRLIGLFYRLHLLNLVWLSPELNSAKQMIHLFQTLKKNGHDFFNMSFHSTSLLPGKSPFVKDQADLDVFLRKIRTFLLFATKQGMKPLTLSEAGRAFVKSQKKGLKVPEEN